MAGQNGPQVEGRDGVQCSRGLARVVVVGGTREVRPVPPADQSVACEQHSVSQQTDLPVGVTGEGKDFPALHLLAGMDGVEGGRGHLGMQPREELAQFRVARRIGQAVFLAGQEGMLHRMRENWDAQPGCEECSAGVIDVMVC